MQRNSEVIAQFVTAVAVNAMPAIDLGLSRRNLDGFLRAGTHAHPAAPALLRLNLRVRFDRPIYQPYQRVWQNAIDIGLKSYRWMVKALRF